MLARLAPLVTRGIIDNTEQGLISLRLWFVDEKEPVHIRMKGDCLHDIAGCRVEFSNPFSAAKVHALPDLVQAMRHSTLDYMAGDITFSRRLQENNNRAAVNNYLYIEFFADTRSRVLIELTEIPYDISLPQWYQSPADDMVQRQLNMEALRAHVRANVNAYRGPAVSTLTKDMPSCHWDFILNRAEACMAIYPTIHEKYGPEPGGYISAAYVMDRTAFLDKLADEDEADMPPSEDVIEHDWEVADFLEPEQAESLARAMRHSMFREASKMTALVQKLIIEGQEKTRMSREAEEYINTYAGIISHMLSTLLLLESKEQDALSAARLQMLIKRLRALNICGQTLSSPGRELLGSAADSLRNGLESLLSSHFR